MGLRSARCYRRLEKPYTRVSFKKPRRSYVKGVPALKIHRFESGNKKRKFSKSLYLVSKEAVQIRHNALEAARVVATKNLARSVGEENYFFKVLIYPHHVLRENPLATGAGADRFQTGMRKSFGRPISSAARVKPNQKILEVRVEDEKAGKKALKVAASKLPAPCFVIDRDKYSKK
ncbi:MAG: 50S ribosomal protein L16 [Candidatus Aenigmarchaeota archaeon]|nr:50S ribosomal protein L16 [Candidatus Aenigmarchaeota archaeon]